MTPFQNDDVEQVYLCMPEDVRTMALTLRELVLDEGRQLEQTGGIQETLKWGQASYLPVKPRIGTTLRVAVHDPYHLALYVNCNTSLIADFGSLFGSELVYSKNRAVLLDVRCSLPESVLRQCVRMGLYYHRDRRGSGRRRPSG